MGKIERQIEALRESGSTDPETMRQLHDLEYAGQVQGDDEPVVDEDEFADEDPDDDRLPSERFYNPCGRR